MKLLLDTHALLWWSEGNRRLAARARAAIEDENNDVFVSAVSAMEIATKHRLGKLEGAARWAEGFEAELAAEGFEPLAVDVRHGRLAGAMLIAHKDPFDRLLIAQAMLEGMGLVSNESLFDAYGVPRIW